MIFNFQTSNWVKQCEECGKEAHVAYDHLQRVASKLQAILDQCSRLKHVPDQYSDYDKADLQVIAEKLRDTFGSHIGNVIRTIEQAADCLDDLESVLAGFGV